MTNSILSNIKNNWKSGLTVALISVPLSLSLAVASGASPETGLITAVWAGLLAGIFASSSYNIIGPAGALTGVLALFAFENGPELLPTLAIVSGVFILIAYFIKLHRYMVLIPRSVMVGFSTGVAILIAISQLRSVFGLHSLPSVAEPVENLKLIGEHIGQTEFTTFAIFALGILLLWVFSKIIKKIPPAIFLAPIGIFVGYLISNGSLPFETLLLNQKYINLNLGLFSALDNFKINQAVLVTGASVAFIAILETLISAKIAGNMTKSRFDSRKELLGLSLANIGSGFFGGLPATGVFVRTGLNVKSGATHKTSQIIQSVFVGLISVLLFQTFTYMPLAIIASILIFSSVKMLEIKDLKKYWKYSKKDFIVAILVVVLMVGIDSVVGLLAGTVLALLYFVENFSKGHFDITRNRDNKFIDRLYEGDFEKFDEPMDVVVYSFKGSLTYVNGETHKDRLHEKMSLFNTVILRMRELGHIDHDGLEILYEIIEELKHNKKDVYITGMSEEVKDTMLKNDKANLITKKMVLGNTTSALKELGFII
ncbi:MAG: sulfate permease, SulP family [Patescibacteria group bacterium]|nr:sulfate permease, SulP family [Patescibacteria group bacterium]